MRQAVSSRKPVFSRKKQMVSLAIQRNKHVQFIESAEKKQESAFTDAYNVAEIPVARKLRLI